MSEFIIYGLMGVVVLLFALCIWLVSAIRSLQRSTRVFFQGKNGENLEQVITEHSKHMEKTDAEIREIYEACEKIHALAFKGIHQIGVIRFNPFHDIGGDQSFAVALLDGFKNGVVFSSLFSKTGTRTYAKPVIKGLGSEKFPLTDEEKQAVSLAASSKPFSPAAKQ